MKKFLTSAIVILVVLLIISGIVFSMSWRFWMGVNGWGPRRTVDTVVTKTYIDNDKQGSHYMVATDSGVYEVDNGWWLGVTNADEIYGGLKEGHRYHLNTKGNKLTWYYGIQYYPYITGEQPRD